MSPLSVHILPKLGKLPVEELDQHLIKETLDGIWHKKPEAAEKALNRPSLTLKHAAALGLDVDLQATMKARALMGKQRRTTEHIPSMPYEDAPAFYQRLKAMEGVSPVALRFLMLTLGRTSEVRLATFDEIAADIWLLTAERRKVGPDFRIPLSTEALRLVKDRRSASATAYLYTAYQGEALPVDAKAKVVGEAGLEARPHGFRATFRTWAEEQTDAAFELKEACLGHVVDTGVVGAYQRSDRLVRRRALMTTWAEFLTKS